MPNTSAAPSIILKPVATASEASSYVAGYFGGAPMMPADFEWPRNRFNNPLLFIGQVDLGMLSDDVAFDGLVTGMPKLPGDGTLYFFWDAIHEGLDTRVLFAPKDAGPLVQHDTPEDTPDFKESECGLLEGGGLDAKGQRMRRLWIEAKPYLSYQSEHELRRNMDRADGADLTQRDGMDAKQDMSLESILGRAHFPNATYSFPWLPNHEPKPEARPEGLLKRLLGKGRKKPPEQLEEKTGLDHESGEFAVPESFPWRWCVVRDVAEQIKGLVTLNEGHIYNFWNSSVPALLHLWKDVPAQAEQWIARASDDSQLTQAEAEAFRAWLDQLANVALTLEVRDSPDPEVLKACAPMLEVLNTHDHKMYTWPDHHKTPALKATEELVPLMGCIKEFVPAVESREPIEGDEGWYQSSEQCPVPYYEEWDAWYVPRTAVTSAMNEATYNLADRLWRYGPDAGLPQDLYTVADWNFRRQITLPPVRDGGNNFGDDGRVPTQMFGKGHLVQQASIEHADKVMLFQMPSGFGMPVQLEGGVLQIWIDPDDLANARFEKSFSTLEST